MTYQEKLDASRSDPNNRLMGAAPQSLLDQKKAALFGAPPTDAPSLANMSSGEREEFTGSLGSGSSTSTNLLDVAQSSLARSGGHMYDTIGDGANLLFGTDIDTSTADGLSNRAVADEFTGVSPEYRQQADAELGQVKQDFEQGNYGKALFGGAMVAPNVLADSAGSMAELAIGGGLVGGAAKLAKMSAKVFGSGDKAFTGGKTLLSKAGGATGKVAKALASASVAASSAVQTQADTFRELHGREPDAGELSSMMLMTSATFAIQAKVVGMFLPSALKGGANPSLQKFKAGMSDLAEYAGEGTIRSLLKTVTKGVPGVVKAGGAEAGQEYLQTWAEILGTKINLREDPSWLEQAYAEVGDGDNQTEAAFGAFLGGIAGGGLKGVIGAPAVAVNATVDVAKGATKAAADVVQGVADNAALKLYTAEDRAEIAEQNKTESEVVKQKVEELKAKATVVSEAKTTEDLLSDPDVAEATRATMKSMEIPELAMKDPKVFKQVQRATWKALKADAVKITAVQSATTGSRIATKIAKTATKNTVDAVSKPLEVALKAVNGLSTDTVAASITGLSAASKTIVTSIESDTARGLIALAKEGGNDKTILEVAKSLSISDMKKVSKVILETNPGLSAKIDSAGSAYENAKTSVGLSSKRVTNKTGIPTALTDVAGDVSLTPENTAAVGLELASVAAGKIADIETQVVIEGVLAKYEVSPEFKNQTSGAMGPKTFASVKAKIERTGRALRKDEQAGLRASYGKLIKGIRNQGAVSFLKDPTNRQEVFNAVKGSDAGKVMANLDEFIPSLADLKSPEKRAEILSEVQKIIEEVGKKAVPETSTPKDPVSTVPEQGSEQETAKAEGIHRIGVATLSGAVELKENVEMRVRGLLSAQMTPKQILKAASEVEGIDMVAVQKVLDTEVATESDSSVDMTEDTDNMATTKPTLAQAQAAYQIDFPGCKI
jgi:hypothetical protein